MASVPNSFRSKDFCCNDDALSEIQYRCPGVDSMERPPVLIESALLPSTWALEGHASQSDVRAGCTSHYFLFTGRLTDATSMI